MFNGSLFTESRAGFTCTVSSVLLLVQSVLGLIRHSLSQNRVVMDRTLDPPSGPDQGSDFGAG